LTDIIFLLTSDVGVRGTHGDVRDRAGELGLADLDRELGDRPILLEVLDPPPYRCVREADLLGYVHERDPRVLPQLFEYPLVGLIQKASSPLM
jgi:hypothetical protein